MKRKLQTPLFVLSLVLLWGPVYLRAQSSMWVSAYYAGWTGLTPNKIDYSAVTHILHFAIIPNSNGTLNTNVNDLDASAFTNAVTAAHDAGAKILIDIGGEDTRDAFNGAMSDANRAAFVNNIFTFINTWGYDGVDIDMEDIQTQDSTNFIPFIEALRAKLDTKSPRPVLTASVGYEYWMFGRLKNEFDQINLMTYDMSGPWPDWITWHNDPIYNGGATFPSNGEPLPCVDTYVSDALDAGIPKSKLGIGIDFYGYVWSGGAGTPTGGVTAPKQSWTTLPSMSNPVTYHEIMDNYYQPQYYRWDSTVQVPYLSIDKSGSANDRFISYDDQRACQAKVNYVKQKGLGGLIIFELGAGYRANLPAGQRDSLLQAVKSAVGPITIPSAPILASPPNGATQVSINPTLSWYPSSGATSYRLQVSTDSTFASTPTLDQSGIIPTSYAVTGLTNNTTYYWRVNAANTGGNSRWSTVNSFTTLDLSGVDDLSGLPQETRLFQNYPNPFNNSTVIPFELSRAASVSIEIYSVLGQKVASLQQGIKQPGSYSVFWESPMSSGVYYYRLVIDGSQLSTKKMIYLR
jgi:chitinase